MLWIFQNKHLSTTNLPHYYHYYFMNHCLEKYFKNFPLLQALLYHPHPWRGVELWRVWCKLVWWAAHQRGLHSHRALGLSIQKWCQQGWCGYPGLLPLVLWAPLVRKQKRWVHAAAQAAAIGEEWCQSQSRGWLCPGRRSWGRPVEGESHRWMRRGLPCLLKERSYNTRSLQQRKNAMSGTMLLKHITKYMISLLAITQ